MLSTTKDFSYVSRLFLVFCLVVINAVCLIGCSEQDYADSETQDAKIVSIESTGDVSSELDEAETEDLMGKDTKDKSEILKEYESQYHATATYQDAFLDQKYLLLGSEIVVQLLIFNGNEQSVVMPRISISHIEKSVIDDFVTIKIYDKMGACISFQASKDDAANILSMLDV